MYELLEVLRSALGKGFAEFVFAVLSLAVIAIGRAIWKWISSLIDYHRRLGRALDAVARKPSTGGPVEGNGIWLTQPIVGASTDTFRAGLEASRILVVANAKGGVGKTTTVANLGARLSEVLEKPVLLIDLDFQGTLSSMSVAGSGSWIPPPGSDSRASHLISGDLRPQEVANTGLSAAGQDKLKIVNSFYDLAQAENRVMIEWLLGDRKKDVRFTLAEILHSGAVRNAFSLIIVDCPPRFTTGAIQALAAGTHLLIPTIMDDPSAEAVVTFVRQVEIFRKAQICPYIKYIGVVGSLQPQGSIEAAKKRLAARLEQSGDVKVKILPEEMFFPASTYFKNAVSGGGIAYIVMGNAEAERKVKAKIDALAEFVRQEMRL